MFLAGVTLHYRTVTGPHQKNRFMMQYWVHALGCEHLALIRRVAHLLTLWLSLMLT